MEEHTKNELTDAKTRTRKNKMNVPRRNMGRGPERMRGNNGELAKVNVIKNTKPKEFFVAFVMVLVERKKKKRRRE